MPYPILGTMTFGIEAQVKPDGAAAQVEAFCADECTRSPSGVLIDTARIYQQATPDGDTETVLGNAFAANAETKSRVSIATKANPMMPPHFNLSKQSVMEQCNTSLKKLGVECGDLFYLHSPDIETDLDETLSGIDELHKQGKIKEFGLSNYPAWAVVDIWYRCKSRGIVVPTVYQGMYSLMNRDMEREMVPVARQFGIRLYMYNPMAGGLLSGRYTQISDLTNATEGRFSPEFDKSFGNKVKASKLYQARYSHEAVFEGLTVLRDACAEAGLPMAEVALRWVVHHSMLSTTDGVILGVSKPEHLTSNLKAWASGPLPASVVNACDAAWNLARPCAESYFRGYGAKPGGVEKFLELTQRKRAAAGDEPPQKKTSL